MVEGKYYRRCHGIGRNGVGRDDRYGIGRNGVGRDDRDGIGRDWIPWIGRNGTESVGGGVGSE